MSDAGFTSLVIILCLFDVFPVSDQTSPGYGMYWFISIFLFCDFVLLREYSYYIYVLYTISFVSLCYVRVLLET